ncbi:hypothetical protein [Curtobacterium phage Penoan]|nr:hypothetical protein [Curtobacterium phage Penoan]
MASRQHRQRREYLHRRRVWLAYLATVPRGGELTDQMGTRWLRVHTFGVRGGHVWVSADGWEVTAASLAAVLALGDLAARRAPVDALAGVLRAARGHVHGFASIPSVRLGGVVLVAALLVSVVLALVP